METSATYSPEDNKLRLYCGRVSREEYLRLKNEGWRTLHKQREAGGGDFVATWSPQRRLTALEYGGGEILDEDMSPAERAADRAERFAGYRDKRTQEATGHADRYDAQPIAHGYQSQARAERAAARHDRIADKAVDAWEKAEYWQRRTAGVISHALYVSSPSVRMGRIKTLEAELRKVRADLEKYARLYQSFERIAVIASPEEQTKAAILLCGSHHIWAEYLHPRAAMHPREYRRTNPTSLYSLLTDDDDAITGKEACELFFSDHAQPKSENIVTRHYELRLAYENQMLEAQGGRAASLEILPGGKIGGKLIVKVCKSPVTGRVVSVFIKGQKVEGYAYRTRKVPGADYSLHQIETERLPQNAYTPPTPESLEELKALESARKAKRAEKEPCPLVNPTEADAEKLQAIWNAVQSEREPATVWKMTQKEYSERSAGRVNICETLTICETGFRHRSRYGELLTRFDVFKVRMGRGGSNSAFRVVVLTDKPQKALPWDALEKAKAKCPTPETVRQQLPAIQAELDKDWINRNREVFRDAIYIGWFYWDSCSQNDWTAAGFKELEKVSPKVVA